MSNPIIQTDLAEVLGQINGKLDKLSENVAEIKVGQTEIEGKLETLDERLTGQIKTLDERLTGQIKALDERLTGQIKILDERLTGQIKTLDTKVEQIDKRVGNQEFINRGVFVGLILVILGGVANLFGWIGKP